jgi:hypothetical protein
MASDVPILCGDGSPVMACEAPQAGCPASLHVPFNLHGACCDASVVVVTFVFCQPAPIQVVGEGSKIGSVPGCGHWDVGSGSLKQVLGELKDAAL